MFFGLEVVPKKQSALTPPYDLRITSAALGLNAKTGERTILSAVVEEKKFVICSLREGGTEQVPLDLFFEAGEEVSFEVIGSASIHITGFYEEDSDEIPEGYADLDEEDLENLRKQGKLPIDDEDDDEDVEDDEEEEGDDEESEEDDEEKEHKSKKQKVSENQAKAKPTPKQKPEAKGKPSPKGKAAPAQNGNTPASPSEKKNPTPKAKATPEQKIAKDVVEKNVRGVKIEEQSPGNGTVAKPGDIVKVRYTGKLANGKIFDSGTIDFKLGAGKVIKGWDEGIKGMKVGQKRKLTIPPELGYGSRGAPPQIPGNSTLMFDVNLLSVKGK